MREQEMRGMVLMPETRGLCYWTERKEGVPQGGYRTYQPGPKHARFVIKVPLWLALLLHRLCATK